MANFNTLSLFLSLMLFIPFRFSDKMKTYIYHHQSANCIHMEIKEPNGENISFAFDFKGGYAYGSSSNQVNAVYMNGGNIKLVTDAQGRPIDFETLHFDYDADGIHQITWNEPQKGVQTYSFASGTKIFQSESKDSRGSWSRAIYTYNSSGDPSEVKFLGEDYNAEGKKEKKEDLTASLIFYPDKPSLDKGNPLICWFLTNYIYGFYKDNFIFGQHLPKSISGTMHETDFKPSGQADETRTVQIDHSYSYEFDSMGRPVAVKILATTMGYSRPVQTFVISYNNCP